MQNGFCLTELQKELDVLRHQILSVYVIINKFRMDLDWRSMLSCSQVKVINYKDASRGPNLGEANSSYVCLK